jgi:hypothetical protein
VCDSRRNTTSAFSRDGRLDVGGCHEGSSICLRSAVRRSKWPLYRFLWDSSVTRHRPWTIPSKLAGQFRPGLLGRLGDAGRQSSRGRSLWSRFGVRLFALLFDYEAFGLAAIRRTRGAGPIHSLSCPRWPASGQLPSPRPTAPQGSKCPPVQIAGPLRLQNSKRARRMLSSGWLATDRSRMAAFTIWQGSVRRRTGLDLQDAFGLKAIPYR